MKKRNLRLLSIALIMLLAIPQNTLAIINNPFISDTKETTVYFSEKNGERQAFTKNSQGAIIPGSIYSAQNIISTNSNIISNLASNNAQNNILKNQLVQQSLTKSSELIYDDTSSFLKYTGSWATATNASNEGGTAKILNNSGNVSFSFTGSSVKWTGFKDPTQGIGRVVIDGITQGEVDLYAANRSYNQLLFEKSLSFGLHTMEIHWAGTPNKNGKAKKKDPFINIDTIRINTSAPKASAPSITSSTGHASNISLTFKNNDESADQLFIYKSIDGTNFTLLSTCNISDSKHQEFWFEDKDVLNNVVYSYYVTAANTIGESEPSNTVTNSKITTNSVYNLEDINSNVNYTGTWDTESNPTDSGGTIHVTVEAGSKVTIPFTAFESRIKLMSGPDMGIARIHWSNANEDYYDANLNAPSDDYWTFGTSSNMQTNSNWVIECVSGKIAFDVEENWNYTTVAPIQPENLKGVLENSDISLVWDFSTELDLKGYNVYRKATADSDLSLLNQVPIASAQFTDTSVLPNQDYTYVVKTVNYANLESDASTEVTINHVITAPTGLIGTLTGTSAVLNWAKHSDTVVTQYNIYRSTTSGSNYELLNITLNPVLTYTDSTVIAGTTYYYVITAVSGAEEESIKSNEVTVVVPVVPPTVPVSEETMQRFEETNLDTVYTGTWASNKLTTFSGGIAKTSNITNSSAEFTFTGTGIRWISYFTANRGKANVYIDGNLISTVDTYSASPQPQKVAFEKLDLLSGSHTIKIVIEGTRNSASTGNYITIDAYEVVLSSNVVIPIIPDVLVSAPTGLAGTLTGTATVLNWNLHTYPSVTQYNIYRSTTSGSNYELLNITLNPVLTYTDSTIIAGTTYYYVITAVSGAEKESIKSNEAIVVVPVVPPTVPVSEETMQRFEETNLDTVYTGTWASNKLTTFSGGIAKTSNITNSSAEFTFTGTGIRWISYFTANRGKAIVYIDGNLISTVDTYSASPQPQKVAFEKLDLLSGSHTIKIVIEGTKNSASTGNYITVDAYEVVLSSNVVIPIIPAVLVSAPTGLTGTLTGNAAVLNWNQHTYPSVTQYNIYRTTSSGSNYQLLNTVLNSILTYTDSTGIAETTYYYAITAVSGAEEESIKSNEVIVALPVVVPPTVPVSEEAIQRFEETNLDAVYTGTWNSNKLSTFSGGIAKTSNITNSSSEFTFTGTGIRWISYFTANRGKATVYIDGNLITTVDTYSASPQAQEVAFEKLDLLSGSHTIKIVIEETRNSASTGNYITIDAFEVILSSNVGIPSIPIVKSTILEETNSNIVYDGTWKTTPLSSFSGGFAKTSNVTNSSSEFIFTGTGIRWISYLTVNRGKANVYIDGNLISTVDTYSASPQAQKVAFEKLDLSSGSHTIKIEVQGSCNSASTDNFITVDAFDVLN